ncbi:MAG TPA: hypothetical protein VFA10_10590, partial [Ktedonobacteraceae bacterium]|nr:hypothetical protein [Ktedonobacteraceae bacterium]
AVDLNTRQVVRTLLSGGQFGPMDYDANTGQVYGPELTNTLRPSASSPQRRAWKRKQNRRVLPGARGAAAERETSMSGASRSASRYYPSSSCPTASPSASG